MKKTQVALAALALVASTAAMADGVTVYGTVDASVIKTDAGTSMAGAGNSAGSLFGFKGSEDLGGGLKASFNLETGYTATSGALANGGTAAGTTTIFNRAANVGLSNESFGLTLGLQTSPFIAGELNGATGVGGNGVFVPALFILNGGNLAGTNSSLGGFFIPDAVNVSANFAGVTANVMTRTAVAGTTTTAGDTYTAANIGTAIAGVNLNLAYQNMTNLGATTVIVKNTVLSANTEIAGIRVNAAYADNSNDGTSNKGYMIGTSMPLTGALAGGLTYVKNAASGLGNMYSASLQYNLSKSTYVYMNYNKFSVDTSVAANDSGNLTYSSTNTSGTVSGSSVAVGIAKSF